MATCTVVITYTPASSDDAKDGGEIVTSMTVGGTAYNSLTAADVFQAQRLLFQAYQKISFDKSSVIQTKGGGHQKS